MSIGWTELMRRDVAMLIFHSRLASRLFGVGVFLLISGSKTMGQEKDTVLERHPHQDAVASSVRDAFSQRLTNGELFFGGPIHIVFEINIPNSLSLNSIDIGPHTELCTYSAFGDLRAMTVETTYERDPVFRDLGQVVGQRPDLDDDGNQIVTRPLHKEGLSGPSTSKAYIMSEQLRVRPGSNRIAMRFKSASVDTYPDQSNNSIYRLFWLRQAVACPLASDVERIMGIRPLAKGGHEVEARGLMGGAGPAEWRLNIAPEAKGCIPREAFITFAGHDRPTCLVKTFGRLDYGGFVLAERGSVTISPDSPQEYRMDIRLLVVSREGAEEHIRAVEKRLDGAIPDGASVFDLRKR